MFTTHRALAPVQKSSTTRRILAALCLSLLAQAAQAATFTVTNTADAGAGSLRNAITQANTNPGADIIDFDATVFSTATPQVISLQSTLPDLTGDVTISGNGANTTTIEGRFDLVRIFRIAAGHVAISGLTLTGGYATATNGADGLGIGTPPTAGAAGLGGAIYSSADLTLTACYFFNCTATGGMGGRGTAATA